MQDRKEHLAKGERHHNEIDAARAKAERADDKRSKCADRHGKWKCKPKGSGLILWGRKGKGIASKPEKCSVAKADKTPKPHNEIKCNGDDAHDHDLRRKLHII